MNPHDLLNVASILLSSSRGRPSATCLRRAVSSCYYALFHCVALESANLLIGGAGSQRSMDAWRQVYRSLEHGPAKARCMDRRMIQQFPREIEDFANTFVTMQEKRHDADYDPRATFAKSSVQSDIVLAEKTIDRFRTASASDRRAFCAYVLLRKRD